MSSQELTLNKWKKASEKGGWVNKYGVKHQMDLNIDKRFNNKVFIWHNQQCFQTSQTSISRKVVKSVKEPIQDLQDMSQQKEK